MAITIGLARPLIASAMGLFFLAGCSGMQSTPMMPTYPAEIGRHNGVSMEADNICRQQAYQAAEKAKQDNVGKEVAFTAIGTAAGAVIGNQIRTTTYHYNGRPHHYYRGRPGPYRGWRGPTYTTTHDMAGAGALAGAAAGAALSQGTLQNTQQVYDITYNNCIERYRDYR